MLTQEWDLMLTTDNCVYFGEYTFTPIGCSSNFTNRNVELDMLHCYNNKNVVLIDRLKKGGKQLILGNCTPIPLDMP